MESNLTLVLPGATRTVLSTELRRLVRAIRSARPYLAGFWGMFGGPDGYGVPIDTLVFTMRAHDENPPDCDCGADDRNNDKYEAWVAAGWAAALEYEPDDCTPICAGNLPNFRHRPSGFEVRWHKYIGRRMEASGSCSDVAAMIDECIASLKGQTDGLGRLRD